MSSSKIRVMYEGAALYLNFYLDTQCQNQFVRQKSESSIFYYLFATMLAPNNLLVTAGYADLETHSHPAYKLSVLESLYHWAIGLSRQKN